MSFLILFIRTVFVLYYPAETPEDWILLGDSDIRYILYCYYPPNLGDVLEPEQWIPGAIELINYHQAVSGLFLFSVVITTMFFINY